MAWQSMTGIGGGGNGGGNGAGGAEGGQQVAQPQGTEYTLQGMFTSVSSLNKQMMLMGTARCYALPPNRMAQTRTRSQWLGDRKAGDERSNCEAGG